MTRILVVVTLLGVLLAGMFAGRMLDLVRRPEPQPSEAVQVYPRVPVIVPPDVPMPKGPRGREGFNIGLELVNLPGCINPDREFGLTLLLLDNATRERASANVLFTWRRTPGYAVQVSADGRLWKSLFPGHDLAPVNLNIALSNDEEFRMMVWTIGFKGWDPQGRPCFELAQAWQGQTEFELPPDQNA